MNKHHKGRGAGSNNTSRFFSETREAFVEDLLHEEDPFPSPRTIFLPDHSKTVVNENKSPDVSFTYSVNPYRGCEHGCSYCYARPTHEYFGMSAGLDFETKILVKENAPELLRARLLSPSWKPSPIFMSGVTDCYQPAERKFSLTRRCLEVLCEFRNPVSVITKNFLVTRDLDIFKEMAAFQGALVMLSVTSLNADLARKLEPRTSTPEARLKAIEQLAKAGVPVGVNVAPVIPGLTDHEMPLILKAAKEAGASFAGYIPVRLPYSVKEIFADWLETHFPEKKNRVLHRIQAIRGGELYNSEFGTRMRGTGEEAELLNKMFQVFVAKHGLDGDPELSTEHFRRPGEQLRLF